MAFGSLLGITASHTLLETARDAMFLAKLPAARLPWMYLAIAAVGLVLSRLGKRGSAKRGPGVPVTLVGAAAVTLGFWAASGSRSPALLYALYVWTGMFASWVTVQFWLLLGNLFTMMQAKRVFGLIGAGSVLGAVLGAAVARALATALPARHLLLGSTALLTLTALGPAWRLVATEGAAGVRPAAPPRDVARRPAGGEIGALVADPYLVRILALVLLSTVAVTTVDYVFKAAVAARVAPDRLGAYFADVYFVLNALSFVVQIGLVGWVLRTFGVHRALWLLPLLLGLGAGGVAAGGGLAAALILKGADGALRHSLHRTATELLFVPLSDALRARVKPVVDLVGQRGGQAVASVAILALVSFGVGERGLSLLVLGLVAGSVVVAASIRRHYLDVFRSTLREGRVDYSGDLPELDLGALEALFSALNSAKDAEVLGALDLLAAQQRQRLLPALILYHPSRAIVLRALDLFVRQGRTDFVPIVDRLLVQRADGEVRAALLRARQAVLPDAALLRVHLADDDPEVRATALVALLARSDGEEGDVQALATLARDRSVAVRMALARAIAEQPSERFVDTLLAMAEGHEPELRAEVARAMGRVRSGRFLPVLLAMTPRREEGGAAREALAALGDPALDLVLRSFDDATLPREVAWGLPRTLAAFDPQVAAPLLVARLSTERDGVVRFRILRALRRIRANDPTVGLDPAVLLRLAEDTLRRAFQLLDWRVVLAEGAAAEPSRRTPGNELLVEMLRDKESYAIGRVFVVLALLHPAEDFDRIHRGLSRPSPKTRASARELVENVVAPPLGPALLVLVDDLPDAERLARAAPFYRAQHAAYEAALRALADDGGELAVVAAYHERELALPPDADHHAPESVQRALVDELATRPARAEAVGHG